MKTYQQYLIGAYGLKKADRLLSKQYFFDKRTVKAIRKYKAKDNVFALGHNRQYVK